jgi:hypothetical protein
VSGAEEGTQPREKSQKKTDHGRSLHDAVDGKAGACKRLILRSNGILRTHRILEPLSVLLAQQGEGPTLATSVSWSHAG